MQNNIFNQLDISLINYWKSQNLSEKDFYCRDCGQLLLDIDDLKNVIVNKTKKQNNIVFARKIYRQKTKFKHHDFEYSSYIESEFMRWCVKGRTLSGKTFFRHICWNCFFKKLPTIIDIPKRARKSTWYKKILNGEQSIPPSFVSPSEYFKLLFDITDEELAIEHQKFDTASKESFIRRHGKDEGIKKYEIYRNRQSYTCSKEYMMNEKGMTEQEWNAFNANRAVTQTNLISRYGKEIGLKKWQEYCDKQAYAGNKLEYFIEKLGIDEGTKKYKEVCEAKALTIKNYIRKYGENEGRQKFIEYLHNTKFAYSKSSQIMFKMIDEKLGEQSLNSKWATKNYEAEVQYYDENNEIKVYRLDFLLGNKIIEFNGDFWHANPKIFKSTDILPFPTQKCLAQDLWNKDEKRIKYLINLGYQIKIVWEHDFYTNKEAIVDECVRFLKK